MQSVGITSRGNPIRTSRATSNPVVVWRQISPLPNEDRMGSTNPPSLLKSVQTSTQLDVIGTLVDKVNDRALWTPLYLLPNDEIGSGINLFCQEP